MTLQTDKEQNIIKYDVYCPFCQNEKAMLISGLSEKTSAIQCAAWGLDFVLRLMFTFGLCVLTRGVKFIEKTRSYKYATYGFCPCCGKTYNAGVPANADTGGYRRPKLYKSVHQKKIKGICGGIAEYTGLPVLVVRITMCLWNMGGVIFYAIAMGVLKDNPNQ
jgi:phage shock protein PspC (stress-responsive transcriptional regulator)